LLLDLVGAPSGRHQPWQHVRPARVLLQRPPCHVVKLISSSPTALAFRPLGHTVWTTAGSSIDLDAAIYSEPEVNGTVRLLKNLQGDVLPLRFPDYAKDAQPQPSK